jgi:IS605 OrfB family transposase
VAVDDISFAVAEGEIFGILGPNGAGKSTTVECIEGLRAPDRGQITVLGLDPQRDRAELTQRLGVQLQDSQLPDQLRVAEALELYSAFYRAPADWHELMEVLGLAGKAKTKFGNLSGGQKRRAERKLRRAQRSLSRKQDGSRNRDKARVKVARAHGRVADARREFHHQLSTALIRENQAVAVEDLCVKGLARTRLAKSVHDAGWSAFTGMLEYKARRYGREFRIGRFVPTSQVCSACGVKDGPKPLHIRTWQCQACGMWLDRDTNAAVNVAKAAGLAVTARGAQVRPGPRVPAQRGEAGTHPKPRRKAA